MQDIPKCDDRDELLAALLEECQNRYSRALSTFAAGVTHEFNNLLSALGGYAQLGADKPDDTELHARIFANFRKVVARGSALVRRMGHLGYLRPGALETTDAGALLTDMLETFADDLVHYGVCVRSDVPALPPLTLDRAGFTLVLVELLQNAKDALLAVAPGARFLDVRAVMADGTLRVTVTDSGAGIAAKDLEHVADPFFTTKGPLALGPLPGAKGLGLTLARGLVERMGGELRFASAPGEGTAVTLHLPAAAAAEAPAHVLVVEDEVPLQRIYRKILETAGFHVSVCGDGEAAHEALARERFNLVILDHLMPRMNGLELLERTREGKSPPRPPIVMVTAAYSVTLARQAIEAGAVFCTAKPINRDRLVHLAASLTGRATGTRAPERILSEESESVLVVDSEPLTGEALELLLKQAGYRCRLADGGVGAVEQTTHDYFDLIVVDLLLHDRDAAETIRQLHLNNPYTPILVMATQPQTGLFARALAAGATRVIPKPVDAKGFLSEVGAMARLFRLPRA